MLFPLYYVEMAVGIGVQMVLLFGGVACSGFRKVLSVRRGTALAQWFRCCATNRKVAGSIPGGVTGIFH